jgi:hypothetical protein
MCYTDKAGVKTDCGHCGCRKSGSYGSHSPTVGPDHSIWCTTCHKVLFTPPKPRS